MTRVGIYDPWLQTLGGGEKVAATWAEALSREPDLAVELIGSAPLPSLARLQESLQVDLSRVTLRSFQPAMPPWLRLLERVRLLYRLRELWRNRQALAMSRDYDLFINVEAFSRLPSGARRSIYYCMFPQTLDPVSAHGPRALYERVISALRRCWGLPVSFLDTYALLTVLSRFSQRWLEARWGRPSTVLYPPVDTARFTPGAKGPVILSVGRFFAGMHNKRHLPMIQAFRALCDAGLQGWEYHLVGGRHQDAPEHRDYYRQVEQAAAGYPIFLHPDMPFAEMNALYSRAAIFWHATGHGEDEQQSPEKSEHFGITTVEAMAAGAVPVVVNKGGQPEIVVPGESGYLWDTLEELQQHTLALIGDPELLTRLSAAATTRSREFSKERFSREAVTLTLDLLST